MLKFIKSFGEVVFVGGVIIKVPKSNILSITLDNTK